MGKVITSQGLPEFIENGTITHVPDHKPGANGTASPEAKPPEKAAEAAQKPKEPEAKAAEPVDDDDVMKDPSQEEGISEYMRKKIGKKHAKMLAAIEQANEAETFAKGQYDRAILAEQRAADLERRLADAKPPEAPKTELVKPDVKDFTKDGQVDWLAFTDANNEYTRKAAIEEFRAEQAKERAASETAAKVERLTASAQVARKAHPDFDEVMGALNGTQADMVPQFVLSYIEECSDPGEMSYLLAKNAEDRERIAKLSPIRGIAELGKLEERLAKAAEPAPKAPAAEVKPPERGGAPPPIIPISTAGTGTVNVDPSTMPYKQLRKYEAERERAKQRH